MTPDWSAYAGIAGGVAGIGLAINQARQKFRIDELASAQAVIKLKQEEIDGWKAKYDVELTEKNAALAKLSVLTPLFLWEKVPPPLQAVLDRLESAVQIMVETMHALEKLVKSETGRMEDDRR